MTHAARQSDELPLSAVADVPPGSPQPSPRRARPIIFSAPMVRALLAGDKTQTRRIARFKPIDGANLNFSGPDAGHACTGVPETGHVLYSSEGDPHVA